MSSYSEIIRVFPSQTEGDDRCVGIDATEDNIDLIVNLNPETSEQDLIAILDAERIEHYEFERPRRIRR
jgi:hypothetical protein